MPYAKVIIAPEFGNNEKEAKKNPQTSAIAAASVLKGTRPFPFEATEMPGKTILTFWIKKTSLICGSLKLDIK